jgi:uncharacterized protein YkwD
MPWESMLNPPGLPPARTETVTRHNTKRVENGVAGLAKDKVANDHAQYAANRIAYESGGGCLLVHTVGEELLAWYNAKTGENIGCIPGCIDVKVAVKAFWNSPPHRAIVLDADFHRIGVGIQCVGDISYFAVHFIA